MTTELTKAAQQEHTPEHIAGVDHAHELLRRMGYHRDGDWFIHVNRRGAEAIHISTISTIVNAAQLALTTSQPAQAGEVDERAVDKAWGRFAIAMGDAPGSPYPGMARAFEAHFGQSWLDKDWRNEQSVWAAAWRKAWDARASLPTQPAAQATPDDGFVVISYQVNDICFSPEAAEAASKDHQCFAEAQATPEPGRCKHGHRHYCGHCGPVPDASAPVPPPQQAAGEPVAVTNERELALLQKVGGLGTMFPPDTAGFHVKLYTHPAPGVPEVDFVGYVSPEALEELRMSGESASIHHWRAREDFVAVYVRRKPGALGAISELLAALGPILAAVSTNDGDSMGHLESDDKLLWTASNSWSADVRVTLGDLRKIALAAAQAKGGEHA